MTADEDPTAARFARSLEARIKIIEWKNKTRVAKQGDPASTMDPQPAKEAPRPFVSRNEEYAKWRDEQKRLEETRRSR